MTILLRLKNQMKQYLVTVDKTPKEAFYMFLRTAEVGQDGVVTVTTQICAERN